MENVVLLAFCLTVRNLSFLRICSVTIAATTSVVIARSLAFARARSHNSFSLVLPEKYMMKKKIRMEIASNSGCSWEGGG
jgi:hypothetical protein